jgi:predicted dehydrogenase
MLEIAVLGAVRIGRIHAAHIVAHPGARLAGIADTVPDAAARLAETLGRGETEFADMRAAYDALPATTQVAVEGLITEHDLPAVGRVAS